MSNNATFKMVSAGDAKTWLSELLNEAIGRPIGITQQDTLTAYLVSKDDFESMLTTIETLQDQLWLARAEDARREGFVGEDRVQEILNGYKDAMKHEKTGNNI